MGITPVLVKSLTQVNTTDAAVGAGGNAHQFDAQIAGLANGGYVVVWTDGSRALYPLGTGIVAQRYDAQGQRVGGEIVLHYTDRTGSSPAVAPFPDGNPRITNSDFIRAYITNGSGLSVSWDGNLIASGGNFSDPAVTLLADGRFVLGSTSGTGDDTDIQARIIYGTEGPIVVHDEADNSGNLELATLSNGNWVAVFQDEFNGNAADNDIRFRVFNGSTPVTGTLHIPAGNDLVVNETDPDVAALTGGGFVVVWTDEGTTVSDIRATVLTNSGQVVRGNILVNATQAGAQNEASVVGLLDGGFLVTWEDDANNVVRAQRFDLLGNPVGDQFTVFTNASPNSSPETARLADGRVAFALVQSIGEDSDVFTSIWNPRGTVASVGDVLWQQSDGTVAIAGRELASAANTWRIQGTGDFDADGDSDILWRHQDGWVVTWEMQNGQAVSGHSIAFASSGWTIQGVGDFDDDGDSDILWRHQDGAVVTWEMEDGQLIGARGIAFASTGWAIQGLGDFDGDGDSDVLWRHQQGAVVTWEMENGALSAAHSIAFASTGWEIRGAGDFDGDGDDDIVWHHTQGAVVTWEMENGAYVSNHSIATGGGSWRIAGTLDFDADGTDDLLWRHPEGTVVTWEMQSGALLRTHNFGVVGNDWQIRGTGEFDLL